MTQQSTLSVDIDLLNTLRIKENYDRYIKYVKEYVLLSQTKIILDAFPQYFKFHPERTEIDWDQFGNWFGLVLHPNWKEDKLALYGAIFANLKVQPKPSDSIIQHFIKLDYATRIQNVTKRIFEGDLKVDLALVSPIMDEYIQATGMEAAHGVFASTDLKQILDTYVRSTGLEWRLEDLNVSVGPLHTSDLVIIGARPETGKTSFLCSEFTFMVSQMAAGTSAVLFNNEERGKLFLRLVEAATGKGIMDIAKDEKAALAAYTAAVGHIDRIRVVEPESGLSTTDIERVLKNGNYGLIGINVLDKVRGFDAEDNEVARLRALSIWARSIASRYAPVVAVQQADASAEGQRWLNKAQLYGSKTGMQGEGDVIIMIGCEDAGSRDRFLSIGKNKLPGGPRTVPALRHGKFEVDFDPETGIYSSKMYRKSGGTP